MQTPTSHAKPPLHPSIPLTTPFSLRHVAPASSMEERAEPSYRHPCPTSILSPSIHPLDNQIIPLQLSPESQNTQPLYGAGTYIVKVPKDQIFRVPTPENGWHMQEIEIDRPQKEGRRCSCCSSRVCLCMVVVLIVVLAAVIGLVIFLTPDEPTFRIEHVTFKKSPPVFDIRVKVQNPNRYKQISYDGKDSNVALTFKHKEIAKGKFPSFDQDHKNTSILGLVLHGSNLPEEILSTNSTKSKTRISLSLSINIPVGFKVAGSVKSRRIDISCSFGVDRLGQDTKILDQNCGTN